jgi:hypothetical protein
VGNDADTNGGGIRNEGTLTLSDSSSIRGNETEYGGGIYNYGTLTLRSSSSISDNDARLGGGVYNRGTLTLKDSSALHHNTASAAGGGIFDSDGTWDGVICGPGGNVHDNSPDDCVLS